jgi:hypothetical protein
MRGNGIEVHTRPLRSGLIELYHWDGGKAKLFTYYHFYYFENDAVFDVHRGDFVIVGAVYAVAEPIATAFF